MDTYRGIADIPTLNASVLTIGTFDGLHLGHQAVIEQLVSRAREAQVPSVVITFDPHPRQVLSAITGEQAPEMIVSLRKKLALLDAWNVDITLVLKFDEAFSKIPARSFLEKYLVKPFHPGSIVVGYDHRFGHNREGNAVYLRDFAEEFHYAVVEVGEVISPAVGDISSSRIRSLIKEGRCEEAEALLGWTYEVEGKVVEGAGRGRDIGFPTANIAPTEVSQLIPRSGVYVVSAKIAGERCFGMANIGRRPTFGGGDLTLEAHFFEPIANDLYGSTLQVLFYHRLRDEKKFADATALASQINIDREKTRQWIAKYQGRNSVHAFID